MKRIYPVMQSMTFRLLVLFTMFFFCLLIAGGIGASFSMIEGISTRTTLLLSSLTQCVVAFCIPAWFTARFTADRSWSFLGITENPGLKPFIGILIVYILALPAMNQIIAWNENIRFPEWASGIEHSLRELEEANRSVADAMMQMSNVWQLIVSICVIGLFTGFSEELFFRGGMQNIFYKGGVKPGMAVWVTAIIFSLMHFQFFGFVPRILMGAFFGYVFLWSGSLWPSIFAHALNNSIVVVGVWVYGGESGLGIDSFGVASSGSWPIAAIASGIATWLFLWRFRNYFFKKKVR